MTDWAEILRANLWMKKNKIDPKNFQKNPYPEIRISGSRKLSAWGSQFFFEWIFFMKKILFMKKNPENIFPDFFLQFLEDFLTKILKIYIFGIFGGVRT